MVSLLLIILMWYDNNIIGPIVHMTSEREPSHTLLTAGASFGVSVYTMCMVLHAMKNLSGVTKFVFFWQDEAIIQQSNRTVTCSTDSHVELLVISKSVSL